VVVNIEATEIDAAQQPLDDKKDENGNNDNVNDQTSDCALDDLIVNSLPGLDTVSQNSVHDNAMITTHHQLSLPATTLPVLTAHSSRASVRQNCDATPLQAWWVPDPSNNSHSTSSPIHLSQMTHEETLHAGHHSVRRAFCHTPFHLVERLFPQPICVRPSQIGAGNSLWNDSEAVIPAFIPVAILAWDTELTERLMGQMYFEHDSQGSHPSAMQQWQHSPAGSVGQWERLRIIWMILFFQSCLFSPATIMDLALSLALMIYYTTLKSALIMVQASDPCL